MNERVLHLDWMKGIAIVCMVQVHTAAALPVESSSIDHPLAFLAAAIGGMAAPYSSQHLAMGSTLVHRTGNALRASGLVGRSRGLRCYFCSR